ncbi:MAG: hypothetical protein Athens071416_103 [Parcubacteria group bacterium Athens0714_16]|nr:MAG: hypothetical protein Athens071416_103 [Parcubacteria group bacterium Athens0714_16]
MAERKKFKYKGLTVNLIGIPVSNNCEKKRKYIKREYLNSFTSDLKENSPKNLLLVYDIPDTLKRERDWFRRQLINLGFILIQRSVWAGPSPLPKYFINYLQEIGLKDKFRIFKLNKPIEDN